MHREWSSITAKMQRANSACVGRRKQQPPDAESARRRHLSNVLLTQFADVDTDCPVLYSKDILRLRAFLSQFSQYGGPLRAEPYIYCPEHNKLLGAGF